MSLEDLYTGVERPAGEDRPWVALNMVASMDGATALEGRSGGLGSSEDRTIFHMLRGAADAVLVGAGTARTEGYGPVRLDESVRERRVGLGRPPVPRLVVVTRSVGLDTASPMFSEADPSSPTTVVAPIDADPDRLAAVAAAGDLVTAGEGGVDLCAALADLRDRGIRFLLCEGGPSLNADLLELGCVDEVNLTVAPLAVGGATRRIFAEARLEDPVRFDLAHCHVAAAHVFLRWVRPL